MGNACTSENGGGLDSLCVARQFPDFVPPFTDHVTYSFDKNKQQEVPLWRGAVARCTLQGFQLESQKSAQHAPKWYTLKEYAPNASHIRLYMSGRIYVEYLADPKTILAPDGVRAVGICCRGRPVYESTKTKNFTHTAQIITSGVVFSFLLENAQGMLQPKSRISLFNEAGNEVILIDDRLPVIAAHTAFYVDFAIVDDGGRNLQLDVILRTASMANSKGSSTYRTCLQDYTGYNSHVLPTSITIGYSNIKTYTEDAGVFVQNFVVSEGGFGEEPVPEPRPHDIWAGAEQVPEESLAHMMLFEGEDARAAAGAAGAFEVSAANGGGDQEHRIKKHVHPQRKPIAALKRQLGATSAAESKPSYMQWMRRGNTGPSMSAFNTFDNANTSKFWYHIRYGPSGPASVDSQDDGAGGTRIEGEFWLTKSSIEKKGIYFHGSSTLCQALTMCICFRFSCPQDFLTLIEASAASVLRHTHIPTNGVVLGVERDPRDSSLLRMFIEHRNEILDDLVICECRRGDLTRSIIHQEVFDAGTTIIYRVTVLHADGSRQASVLEVNAEQFEESNFWESAGRGTHFQLFEDPSPRFPISPSLGRHDLAATNRIFIYSSVSFDPTKGITDDGLSDIDNASMYSSELTARADVTEGSETGPEEFQSAQGGDVASLAGFSDAEDVSTAGGSRRTDYEDGDWRRPLIESVVLCRVEETPFKCFPSNLTS